MVDESNHDNYQQLFDELRRLDAISETGYNANKFNIIHDLAEARFYEAKAYFIAGLQNPDPDYRRECIRALVTHWRDSDPQIVSRLLDMAINEPDSLARFFAIDSFRILKTQEALPVLKKIAENQAEGLQLRNTVNEIFIEIADNFPETHEFPKFDLRSECRHLFEQLRRLESITNHSWNERDYNIIDDLARADFSEAKPHFMKGLDHLDPGYRNSCVVALGLVWKEESPEFISKLLDMAKNDPDAHVRHVALFVLGALKRKEALPLLKRIVEDDQQSLLARETAYSQILSIHDYSPGNVLAIMEKFDLDSIDKDLLDNIPDHHDEE